MPWKSCMLEATRQDQAGCACKCSRRTVTRSCRSSAALFCTCSANVVKSYALGLQFEVEPDESRIFRLIFQTFQAAVNVLRSWISQRCKSGQENGSKERSQIRWHALLDLLGHSSLNVYKDQTAQRSAWSVMFMIFSQRFMSSTDS